MIHKLKTWPKYFQEVKNNNKRFEARLNDRDFKVGDGLILIEYDTDKGYTGDMLARTVTYILSEPPFVPRGYVIMSLANDAVVEFCGEYVTRSAMDKWDMKLKNSPQISRHGVKCEPWLVSDPEEFGMHSKWAWCAVEKTAY